MVTPPPFFVAVSFCEDMLERPSRHVQERSQVPPELRGRCMMRTLSLMARRAIYGFLVELTAASR